MIKDFSAFTYMTTFLKTICIINSKNLYSLQTVLQIASGGMLMLRYLCVIIKIEIHGHIRLNKYILIWWQEKILKITEPEEE